MENPIDIIILSNGPGELATWVQPVVKVLRQRLGDDRNQVRISVVLSPCANASGREFEIARSYSEVDRVQAPQHFYPFLFWGKTFEQWDWRDRGVVLFLGGDQFYSVMIGKRLGYRIITYAEWEARWHSLVDRFGVMRPEIAARVSPKYQDRFTVVGDLMTEASWLAQESSGSSSLMASLLSDQAPLIGILPGSKAAKLTLGVPLGLAVADQIYRLRPATRFVIVVAPSLDLPALAAFANPARNPIIRRFGWGEAELVVPQQQDQLPYLQLPSGLQIALWTQSPAYSLLTRCQICLTTIGANTAELGSLAVPMMVLIPTQQLDAMRAQDGLVGALANLPGAGTLIATVINWLALRQGNLLAWPNIWAKQEIVPELVGKLQPGAVAEQAVDLLDHPAQLEQMRDRLRQVRGEPGAAEKLVQLVMEELAKTLPATERNRPVAEL